MQIGHDAGSTVLEKNLGKRAHGKVGTLRMDVSIDEPRSHILAAGIQYLRLWSDILRYITGGDDAIIYDGNIGKIHLRGEYIHQCSALDDHVSFSLAIIHLFHFTPFHALPSFWSAIDDREAMLQPDTCSLSYSVRPLLRLGENRFLIEGQQNPVFHKPLSITHRTFHV